MEERQLTRKVLWDDERNPIDWMPAWMEKYIEDELRKKWISEREEEAKRGKK